MRVVQMGSLLWHSFGERFRKSRHRSEARRFGIIRNSSPAWEAVQVHGDGVPGSCALQLRAPGHHVNLRVLGDGGAAASRPGRWGRLQAAPQRPQGAEQGAQQTANLGQPAALGVSRRQAALLARCLQLDLHERVQVRGILQDHGCSRRPSARSRHAR
ncbi:uncharacterized protein [Dermacentor andersoni]|uniref:uncharacterized protein isoform X2 n=1 Tax=Dermacentor andersoni TaxID=34620 RepID=UPI003B3A487B